MAQEWKVEKVHHLKEELKNYSTFVFTNFRGMNVEQMSGLRRMLRKKGAEFHVVKNRFVKRAFDEMGYADLSDMLVDPTALVYCNADVTEIAKILIEASKDTSIRLKGAYSEGSLLSALEIERVSKLPSKQVLVAQAIGLLNAPVTGLVFTLGGVLSKFVRTLKAIEQTKN